MDSIIWFFLPVILLLGIITSYEDIKYGKIRNKWTFNSILYSLIFYIVYSVSHLLKNTLPIYFIFQIFINFIFSVILGFGLWYFNIWTAGDGKLFIAYSCLVPLSIYGAGLFSLIPIFTLLVNVFILGLLYMVFLIFANIDLMKLNKAIKSISSEFVHPQRFLISVVNLFAVYWLVSKVLDIFSLKNSLLFSILLTIVLVNFINSSKGKEFFYISLTISLLRFIVDNSVYTLNFLYHFLILLLAWECFRILMEGIVWQLSTDLFRKEVPIDGLKAGMVLAETISLISPNEKNNYSEVYEYSGSYYIKEPKNKKSRSFLKEEAEGLTPEQVNLIKKIGIRKLLVSQTIPFAPFMIFGVLFTIIAKGNLLIFLRSLFL